MSEPKVKQCDCGQKYDLRPYGPGGKWVCFQCGTGSFEALAESEKNFLNALDDASKLSSSVLLSEVGPIPILSTQSKLLH